MASVPSPLSSPSSPSATVSSPTLSPSRVALHPLRPSPMSRIRARLGSGMAEGTEPADLTLDGGGSAESAVYGGAIHSSVSRLSSRALQSSGAGSGAAGGMDEDKLRRYKTVTCQRLGGAEGCKYGVHCDLSVQHSTTEHSPVRFPAHTPAAKLFGGLAARRPLSSHCQLHFLVLLCPYRIDTVSLVVVPCSAHSAEELRRSLSVVAYAPVLCSVKGCSDSQCKFAHNMAESQYHPDVYKTKLCSHFDKPSGCPVSRNIAANTGEASEAAT